MAGKFAALWSLDPKFSALKDLNPFKTMYEIQKASSILKVGFARFKWPYLHRAYLVTVPFILILAVYNAYSMSKSSSQSEFRAISQIHKALAKLWP